MPDHETDESSPPSLDLARQGIGLTSPNPCVGAVVVTGRHKVGTGSYTYDV